jgi:hypothetical protein
MTLSLRAAAIASVIAVVVSTSVMAQTTGAIPPPAPPSEPSSPPPTANQYSSNELIDAGHQFFGSVSRGLAGVVEKAVSKWGLPNGYILGEEASGAPQQQFRAAHISEQNSNKRPSWQGLDR